MYIVMRPLRTGIGAHSSKHNVNMCGKEISSQPDSMIVQIRGDAWREKQTVLTLITHMDPYHLKPEELHALFQKIKAAENDVKDTQAMEFVNPKPQLLVPAIADAAHNLNLTEPPPPHIYMAIVYGTQWSLLPVKFSDQFKGGFKSSKYQLFQRAAQKAIPQALLNREPVPPIWAKYLFLSLKFTTSY